MQAGGNGGDRRDEGEFVSSGLELASFAREVESFADELTTNGERGTCSHEGDESGAEVNLSSENSNNNNNDAVNDGGSAWMELPVDLKQKVFSFFSLEELFQLREVNQDPALRQELRLRIRRLLPLYQGWLEAPLEHRNLIEYRDRANRETCKPREFANLTRVVLGGLQMKTLPASVGEMRNLVVMYLDENCLSSLPREIQQCSHLRVLDLMGNQFIKFPDVVLSLRDVTFFSISFNKDLRNLPNSIGDCFPHIQGFGGFGCSLEYLPDSLLQRLDRNPRSFANVQYNNFDFGYVREITRKYPSLKRKLAIV